MNAFTRMWEKIKQIANRVFFVSPTEISNRAYRGTGNGLLPPMGPPAPGQELRPMVKSLLVGIPWWTALIVAYLYWLSTSGQIAPDAVKYGVFKTALAVVLTMAADFSLFYTVSGKREVMASGIRLMARAVIFLGVCWMLSIA